MFNCATLVYHYVMSGVMSCKIDNSYYLFVPQIPRNKSNLPFSAIPFRYTSLSNLRITFNFKMWEFCLDGVDFLTQHCIFKP